MRLRRAFSFCSSLSCLAWSTSIMPNSRFQRWKVCSLICCSRQTSRIVLSVRSASLRTRIFCSVVYLLPFFVWVLSKGPDSLFKWLSSRNLDQSSEAAERRPALLQAYRFGALFRLIIPLSGIPGSFRSRRLRSGGHGPTKQSRPRGLGVTP